MENGIGLRERDQPLSLGRGIRSSAIDLGEKQLLGVGGLIRVRVESRRGKHLTLFKVEIHREASLVPSNPRECAHRPRSPQ